MAGPVGTLESFRDDFVHHLVGHQLAALDEGASADAHGGVLADRLTQQVARADVFKVKALAETLRLRPFAAARRPEEDNSHRRPHAAGARAGAGGPGLMSSWSILRNNTSTRKGNSKPSRRAGGARQDD